MIDPHLVAYVVNATSLDHAEVVLTVATRDVDDEWYDNHDMHVIPFWTCAISTLLTGSMDDMSDVVALEVPPIPSDWIDHLHREADKFAAKATTHKVSGLLAQLGLDLPRQHATPTKPMRR
jgi:hypothetical protein